MRSTSLTTKLLGICSGTLVVMFGACLYMFLKAEEQQAEAVKSEWLTVANSMESKIGMQFFDRYGDVQGFARNTILQTKNIPEITKALNAYVNIFQTYDLIMLVDTSGQVVATSSVDADNKALDTTGLFTQNFANTPWFTNTINERFSEDPNKKLTGVYMEDILIDPITTQVYHGKRLGMSFSTPVRDDKGKTIGVLTVRSSMRWIEEEFEDLYSHMKDSLRTMDMVMTNKKGEIVLDYDPAAQNNKDKTVRDFDNTLFKVNLITLGQAGVVAASQGKEGTIVSKHGRKGTMVVSAYTNLSDEKFLDDLGWCILVQVEEDVLLGDIMRAKQLFFAISGLVLALCVLGSGFFAIGLSRRLKHISQNIAQSGNTVDQVSHQLSGASQDLSSGATEVASSLEETVSSLEELTSMVKTNADNAGEAASLAQSSSRIAKEGESEVQNLISAISDINQSSKKIEEIINVIDDIAFQTNLLALNAAVEAARAGEQGKGFAVVAEAVRNLAQRSGTAAKEITSLIGDNVEKIDRGTKIADRSGQVLQNILSSVRKVADLNNEIAAASKEQSTGLTQISKAMNEIDQATQRNAAASEEVASSSDEMSGQAATLQNTVAELSQLVTGSTTAAVSHPSPPPPAARVNSNVTPLKRPPPAKARRAAPVATAAATRAKTHAEAVIPFGDEAEDEPPAKISSTAGF